MPIIRQIFGQPHADVKFGLPKGSGEMNSPAVEQLQRIAKSGDVAAMTALGIRLMTGHDAPMSPFDGAQLITDAAAKGDAQAAGIVAVLAGAGACMPQNWPLAFDYLQLAAERG